jgi:D-alanyl-D-alanine dipeptidase
MMRHGFNPFRTEWWHFTLADEPFPDTYFKFPVRQLKKQTKKKGIHEE